MALLLDWQKVRWMEPLMAMLSVLLMVLLWAQQMALLSG